MAKIQFNKIKKALFQKAYNRAVMNGDEKFVFEGHQFLTSYAKYLLEHLNNTLK